MAVKEAFTLKHQVISWLTLMRLGPTARGVLPFLLGTTIAWSQGYPINWEIFALSTFAIFCVMLMTFLINEYYDYEADIINKDFHSLSGGTRVLPLGLIPRHQALIPTFFLLLLASATGLMLYFYYKTGPLTIPLGALAIFIGYSYTAKPFKFCYRGLGEIAIFTSCGWLATIVGYYLHTGYISSVATLASLPGAISVFLVILINELPDIASDEMVGKRNLAVRLGEEKTAILYSIVLILCYINIIAISFFGVPKISVILSLILLPLIGWNILTINRKEKVKDKKTKESLSMNTMLIDHLISFIYIGSFIFVGLGLIMPRFSDLLMISFACLLVFVLEGLGIFFSSILRKWE